MCFWDANPQLHLVFLEDVLVCKLLKSSSWRGRGQQKHRSLCNWTSEVPKTYFVCFAGLTSKSANDFHLEQLMNLTRKLCSYKITLFWILDERIQMEIPTKLSKILQASLGFLWNTSICWSLSYRCEWKYIVPKNGSHRFEMLSNFATFARHMCTSNKTKQRKILHHPKTLPLLTSSNKQPNKTSAVHRTNAKHL